MRTITGSLLAAALMALIAAPAPASTLERRALRAVSDGTVYAEPSVADLVNQKRLAYAARAASHAADGAPVKVLFIDLPHRKLNPLRDRLFVQLALAPYGAIVVATPHAVTIRTGSLTSDQENGIVSLDAHLFQKPGAGYTEPLAELVYDVGLVIHNMRPGVAPRGSGRDRNLATFSGMFPDERRAAAQPDDTGWVLPVAGGWLVAALVGLPLYAVSRRRRLSG